MSKVNSKVITGTHLSHFPTAVGFLDLHGQTGEWCLRDVAGHVSLMTLDLDNILCVKQVDGDTYYRTNRRPNPLMITESDQIIGEDLMGLLNRLRGARVKITLALVSMPFAILLPANAGDSVKISDLTVQGESLKSVDFHVRGSSLGKIRMLCKDMRIHDVTDTNQLTAMLKLPTSYENRLANFMQNKPDTVYFFPGGLKHISHNCISLSQSGLIMDIGVFGINRVESSHFTLYTALCDVNSDTAHSICRFLTVAGYVTDIADYSSKIFPKKAAPTLPLVDLSVKKDEAIDEGLKATALDLQIKIRDHLNEIDTQLVDLVLEPRLNSYTQGAVNSLQTILHNLRNYKSMVLRGLNRQTIAVLVDNIDHVDFCKRFRASMRYYAKKNAAEARDSLYFDLSPESDDQDDELDLEGLDDDAPVSYSFDADPSAYHILGTEVVPPTGSDIQGKPFTDDMFTDLKEALELAFSSGRSVGDIKRLLDPESEPEQTSSRTVNRLKKRVDIDTVPFHKRCVVSEQSYELLKILLLRYYAGDNLIGFIDEVDNMSVDQRIEALTRI